MKVQQKKQVPFDESKQSCFEQMLNNQEEPKPPPKVPEEVPVPKRDLPRYPALEPPEPWADPIPEPSPPDENES